MYHYLEEITMAPKPFLVPLRNPSIVIQMDFLYILGKVVEEKGLQKPVENKLIEIIICEAEY